GEPRRRLLRELERLREVGVLAEPRLIRVPGECHAEVVRGVEPQVGIAAGLAARLEQRLLGGLVVLLDQRGDALVVAIARAAVLAALPVVLAADPVLDR